MRIPARAHPSRRLPLWLSGNNPPARRLQSGTTSFGLPPPTTPDGQIWHALFLQSDKRVQEVERQAKERVQEVVQEVDKAADKRVQEVDKAAEKRVQDAKEHADEMKKELEARIDRAEQESLNLSDEKKELEDKILKIEAKSRAIVMDRYLVEKIVVKFCRDRRLKMKGYGGGWKLFYEACIAARQRDVEKVFFELVQKPGFQKLKLDDLKPKLESLYERLSTSLHYPDIPKQGLFAGYGEEPVRAALCVAAAVAQTTQLLQKPKQHVLEDTVLLLNRENDVACMIHDGKLLDVPEQKSAQGQQPGDKSAQRQQPGDKSAQGQQPGDKSAQGQQPGDKSAQGQQPGDTSAQGQQPGNKSA